MVVGIADGAPETIGSFSVSEFLNEFTGRQVIEFYHVAEYLNEVADIIISNGAEKEAWLSSRCHTNNRWNAFWRKISLYGVKIEADSAS